jgi:hypothetical protein
MSGYGGANRTRAGGQFVKIDHDRLRDRIRDGCDRSAACIADGGIAPYEITINEFTGQVTGRYLHSCGHEWQCNFSLAHIGGLEVDPAEFDVQWCDTSV